MFINYKNERFLIFKHLTKKIILKKFIYDLLVSQKNIIFVLSNNNNYNIMYKIETIKNGITGCGAYDTADTTISTELFETLKEARKEIRLKIKNEGFRKYAGYITNFNDGLTLYTNF